MTSTAIRNPSGRLRATRRSFSLIAPGIAAALALAACGSSDSAGSDGSAGATDTEVAESGAEITVTGQWARTSPMATDTGVVYFTISSASGDALVGASVDPSVAAEVQVHETVMVDPSDMEDGDMDDDAMDDDAMDDEAMEEDAMEDEPMDDDHSDMGVMQMREVGTIELPAGETVTLAPGGLHIMLIELAAPLETDQTFDLTLDFETADDLVVAVTVSEDAPSS